MKYRDHRGGLKESMDTVVEIQSTKEALFDYLKKRNPEMYGKELDINKIHVEFYSYDKRIGWNTHIVFYQTENGTHVFGFTDTQV